MRALVVVVLVSLVALAAADPVEVNMVGWHTRVGIPEAERIRKVEESMLARTDHKIVGGVVSAVNAVPHLAGLIIDLVNVVGNSVCGASLISANRVITAAHCWTDTVNQAWRFTVVLGSQYLFIGGGVRLQTSTVILHPNWTPATIANDVAIVYLPTSVWYTAAILPIALPTDTLQWDQFVGEWGTAAGYGKTTDQLGVTTSTLVSQVNLQVITVALCRATYGAIVLDSNICTSGVGGVGICGGDSGGPLSVVRNGQNVLVGISSFVAAAGCQLGYPSSFARVTSFLPFIQQHL